MCSKALLSELLHRDMSAPFISLVYTENSHNNVCVYMYLTKQILYNYSTIGLLELKNAAA